MSRTDAPHDQGRSNAPASPSSDRRAVGTGLSRPVPGLSRPAPAGDDKRRPVGLRSNSFSPPLPPEPVRHGRSPSARQLACRRTRGAGSGSASTSPRSREGCGHGAPQDRQHNARDRAPQGHPKRMDLGRLPHYNSPANKRKLYGEQAGDCAGCGALQDTISRSGPHHLAQEARDRPHRNLQLSCGSCNRIKGDRVMEHGVPADQAPDRRLVSTDPLPDVSSLDTHRVSVGSRRTLVDPTTPPS